MQEIQPSALILSLGKLREQLTLEALGTSCIAEALTDNPWYSRYYIAERLRNIRSWLTLETLKTWRASFPPLVYPPRPIGLITAGNLPLVGFHDVLTILLSGHQLLLKCSRRDKVLMDRVLDLWQQEYPALSLLVRTDADLRQAEFLIASGSDQTARQLRSQYPNLPMILRKHRFSVAILEAHTAPNALQALMQDIFLFNGMGCRSVSNIFLPATMLSPLTEAAQSYPTQYLTPFFQQKVAWERAKMKTTRQHFWDAQNVLLTKGETLKSPEIGVLNLLFVEEPSQTLALIQKNKSRLQCIVNKGTEFGESQYPSMEVFEDNVNVMEILTRM